jgi:hypothetical protein
MPTDDDWMNPQDTSYIYEKKPRKDGTVYLIERKKRIPVTGNVAFIEQWDTWCEFDSKDERDEELAKLRKSTSWHLRGRSLTYIGGRPIHRDPTEYMDF